MVPPILQSFSLFPYSKLWNFGGKTDVHSTMGVIISIILYIVIGVLFFINLADAIKLSKVASTTQYASASSEDILTLDFIAANITTTQNDPQNFPFMIAFEVDYHLKLIGKYQTCTPNHFSLLPNIALLYEKFKMKNWKCFPINSTMQITQQNSPDNQTIKYLRYYIDQVVSGAPIVYFFNMYTLNFYPNPTNGTVWTVQLSKKKLTYSTLGNSYYNFYINQNILNSDTSIMPWTSLSSTNGYFLDSIVNIQDTNFLTLYMDFYRSKKTFINGQTYTKFFDIIAYIGGIFVSLIGVFIFMGAFGEAVFQMFFAYRYFKQVKAKKYSIFSFCKSVIYNILSKIGCKPNWKLQQTRYYIRQAVDSLLDVVYLLQRIQFLEKAIHVVLDKHQIKGLNLIQQYTPQSVKINISELLFKKKMVLSMFHKLALQQQMTQNNSQIKNMSSNIIAQEIRQYSQNPSFAKQRKVNNQAVQKVLYKMEKGQPGLGQIGAVHPDGETEISQGILDSFDFESGDIQQEQLYNNDQLIQNINDIKLLIDEGNDKAKGNDQSKKIVGMINQSLIKNLLLLIQQYENRKNRVNQKNLILKE